MVPAPNWPLEWWNDGKMDAVSPDAAANKKSSFFQWQSQF
jgi:hypothetical protein